MRSSGSPNIPQESGAGKRRSGRGAPVRLRERVRVEGERLPLRFGVFDFALSGAAGLRLDQGIGGKLEVRRTARCQPVN